MGRDYIRVFVLSRPDRCSPINQSWWSGLQRKTCVPFWSGCLRDGWFPSNSSKLYIVRDTQTPCLSFSHSIHSLANRTIRANQTWQVDSAWIGGQYCNRRNIWIRVIKKIIRIEGHINETLLVLQQSAAQKYSAKFDLYETHWLIEKKILFCHCSNKKVTSRLKRFAQLPAILVRL